MKMLNLATSGRILALSLAVTLGSLTTQTANATPYLFETFGGPNGEIASLNPSATYEYAAHQGNIGAVTAGGGKVYWTEGANLWSANGDLSNASIMHVNGLSPNGLAVDVSSGHLFETFGGPNGEIASLNATATAEYGAHQGNIGAVVAGGGKVYWTEGKVLWYANEDLSDAAVLHINGGTPTGLALDVADGYLYETFTGFGGEIALETLDFTQQLGSVSGHITSVTTGGDKVYWTVGADLWSSNMDLSNAGVIHTNGLAPNGLAFLDDATQGNVPEPASLLLVGAGLVGMLRNRRKH